MGFGGRKVIDGCHIPVNDKGKETSVGNVVDDVLLATLKQNPKMH